MACAQAILLSSRLESDREETRRRFEDGITLAERAGEVRLLAQLNTAYGASIGTSFGDAHHYLKYCTEGARLGAQVDYLELEAMSGFFRLAALVFAGDLIGALRASDTLLERLPDDPHFGASITTVSPLLGTWIFRASALASQGHLATACALLREAEHRSVANQLLETAGWASWFLGIVVTFSGSLSEVRTSALRTATHHKHFDTQHTMVLTSFSAGLAQFVQGEPQPAIASFEDALKIGHVKYSTRMFTPLTTSYRAEAHLAAGDHQSAHQHALNAIAFAEQNRNQWF